MRSLPCVNPGLRFGARRALRISGQQSLGKSSIRHMEEYLNVEAVWIKTDRAGQRERPATVHSRGSCHTSRGSIPCRG